MHERARAAGYLIRQAIDNLHAANALGDGVLELAYEMALLARWEDRAVNAAVTYNDTTLFFRPRKGSRARVLLQHLQAKKLLAVVTVEVGDTEFLHVVDDEPMTAASESVVIVVPGDAVRGLNDLQVQALIMEQELDAEMEYPG